MAGTVQVTVYSVAGESRVFELACERSTFLDLKAGIARAWKVPVSCQKLLHGQVVMQDSHRVASKLCFTMVVSLEGACASLRQGSSGQKIAVLKDLSYLKPKDGEVLPAAISSALEDRNSIVREAAVNTLMQVSAAGDQDAIFKLRARLEDSDSDVRIASLRALVRVAEHGPEDHSIVDALVVCLTDSHWNVRQAAKSALLQFTQFAQQGDQYVLAAVTDFLRHQNCDVRTVAMEIFAQLATRGDQDAIDTVILCLQDHHWVVRRAAAKAVIRLSVKGDCHTVTQLATLLGHPHGFVRAAALEALVEIAAKGDQYAINGTTAHLANPDSNVRNAVRKALMMLAEYGDQNAIDAVSAHLQHQDAEVRASAVETLAGIADKGNKSIMAVLSALLSDDSTKVRQAAVEALAVIAGTGDRIARREDSLLSEKDVHCHTPTRKEDLCYLDQMD